MLLVQRDDTYTLNRQFSSSLLKRRKLAEKPVDLLKVPDILSTRVYRAKRYMYNRIHSFCGILRKLVFTGKTKQVKEITDTECWLCVEKKPFLF